MKNFLMILFLVALGWGRGWAQGTEMDSLLPPDHILEDVPWLGDDGKLVHKGLFSFVDLRSPNSKDLILIYRASDPTADLSKPHAQTLVVCFYNPTQKKYEKAYTEDGGQVQWVKVVPDDAAKKSFLFLDRLDAAGQQELKGYAFLDDAVQPVLQAQDSRVFVRFAPDAKGVEVLCSDKAVPSTAREAEHVFQWNAGKSLFEEDASSPADGWNGTSIAAAGSGAVTAITTPVVVAALPAAVSALPVEPIKVKAVPARDLSKDWWGKPFDPASASAKLNNEIVPASVKAGQLAALGKRANDFFQACRDVKTDQSAVSKMRADYYTAVASAISDRGGRKAAAYYLGLALKIDPSNSNAADLKTKLQP
ncbi:MAG: hypothetical protein ACREL1_06195 [bacterium]